MSGLVVPISFIGRSSPHFPLWLIGASRLTRALERSSPIAPFRLEGKTQDVANVDSLGGEYGLIPCNDHGKVSNFSFQPVFNHNHVLRVRVPVPFKQNIAFSLYPYPPLFMEHKRKDAIPRRSPTKLSHAHLWPPTRLPCQTSPGRGSSPLSETL